jgi:zinc protease
MFTQNLLKKLKLVAAFTFILNASFAQKDIDNVVLDKTVKYGKLPNGLTYYIKKNTKPESKVELRLVVNAGSVLERDDQQGVAHFLEHMAFNGTKNFPKNKLVDYLEKSGVKFGADLNASTNFDETIYMLPISTKDPVILSNAYQIIRDWAGNMLLDPAEIDKERGIIMEEKRMRQGAGMRSMTKYFPVLTNGSMYGKRIPIGKEEVIKTAPKKVFADFYRDWYRPNNMAVVVVGDINVAEAEATIKKLFGDLQNPANAPKRPEIIPIKWHAANKAFVVTDEENTNNILQVIIGLHKQEDQTKWGAYGNGTLNEIISNMFQNRLSEYGLKAKSPIGFGGISLDGEQFRGQVGNSIFALVKTNATDALKTVVEEVLKAKQFGFTAEEFERAKKDMLKEFIDNVAEKDKIESSSYVREYINNFLKKEPAPGIEAEKKYVDSYLAALTLDRVNKKVASFNLNEPTFILYNTSTTAKDLPSEKSLLADYEVAKNQAVKAYEEKAIAKDLMDAAPTAGKTISKEDNADYKTTSLMLSNGIKVIYKKTDFKNDEIVLRGNQWGGFTNLTEKEIQNTFYLQLVNQLGVGSHKAIEVQKMMSGVNANVFIGANNNSFSVFGSSAVTDFEKMLQLLHLKMTNINFDVEELEGLKSGFAQQIGNIKKNPAVFFSDTLNRYRFNFSKRIPTLPSVSDIEKVSVDDIKSLYLKMVNNLRGATFVFVGNIDEANFQTMVEKYIGSIPTKEETVSINKENIVRPITGKNSFTIKGGKENKSEINVSYYGRLTNFDDKENISYALLAEVLQIKTTEKLREDMGGTYSPRVGGQMNRLPLLDYNLSLNVPSAPENVDKLTAAFEEIVKNVIAGGITDVDLLKAKEQRKKSFETQQKMNNFWVSQIETQDMYKFDTKLFLNYVSRIDELKKEDLINVAKKYLSDSNVLKAVMNPDK